MQTLSYSRCWTENMDASLFQVLCQVRAVKFHWSRGQTNTQIYWDSITFPMVFIFHLLFHSSSHASVNLYCHLCCDWHTRHGLCQQRKLRSMPWHTKGQVFWQRWVTDQTAPTSAPGNGAIPVKYWEGFKIINLLRFSLRLEKQVPQRVGGHRYFVLPQNTASVKINYLVCLGIPGH